MMSAIKTVIPAKARIFFVSMRKKMLKIPAFAGMTFLLSFIPSFAQAQYFPTVYLEQMTWMEVQQKLNTGTTTVIVPTGGTQQMGPQLVLGAPNAVARYAAGEIARKLGNALVAPAIPYSPAGRINPPEGHMMFAGTISTSDYTYSLLLEEVVRSLKQHGFRLICLIGDEAGAQAMMSEVAYKLSNEWRTDGVRVIYVSSFYNNMSQEKWVDSMNIRVHNPQAHAGLIDTAEMMAVDATGVRDSMLANRSERDYRATGASGDSSLATAAYGRRFLSLKIEAAVEQIQHASNAQ